MLLVEDEKKVSELVARALRSERYAVDVAEDGPSGWEFVEAYDYDLIILDVMLPALSGTDLLKRIRRKNQQVPILCSRRATPPRRRCATSRLGRTTISPSRSHSRNSSCGEGAAAPGRWHVRACCAWRIWRSID
jgi:DNA-binding NarL/FixJ family response regulator